MSLSELLSADDVKNSLALASSEGDQQSIKLWQERLLLAADEVNLKPSERNLISGEQGLVFLEFQGMKTNYQREFEQAFYEFGDVDAIYAKYPAFESLHAQSQDLVTKRDTLIESIALELSTQGTTMEEARATAQQQWQLMMQSGSLKSDPEQ